MTAAPVVDRAAMDRAQVLFKRVGELYAAGHKEAADALQPEATVAWMQALGRHGPARQAVRQ